MPDIEIKLGSKSTSTVSIPKLHDERQFVEWDRAIRNFAKAENILGILDGSWPCPVPGVFRTKGAEHDARCLAWAESARDKWIEDHAPKPTTTAAPTDTTGTPPSGAGKGPEPPTPPELSVFKATYNKDAADKLKVVTDRFMRGGSVMPSVMDLEEGYKPSEADIEDYRRWRAACSKLSSTIERTIAGDLYHDVSRQDNAKEKYDFLKMCFPTDTRTHKAKAKLLLARLQIDRTDPNTLRNHMTTFSNLVARAIDAGLTEYLDPTVRINAFYNTIGIELSGWRTACEAKLLNVPLELRWVRMKNLWTEEVMQRTKVRGKGEVSFLTTGERRGDDERRGDKGGGYRGGKGRGKGGKKGDRNAGSGGSGKVQKGDKDGDGEKYKDYECWNCGKKGHLKSDCRSAPNSGKKKSAFSAVQEEADYMDFEVGSLSDFAGMAKEAPTYASVAHRVIDADKSILNVHGKSWVADSGCTSHLTNNKHLINNLRPLAIPLTFGVAESNASIKATAVGSTYLPVKGGGHVRLSPVYYAEHAAENLLSIPSAMDNGWCFNTNKHEGWLRKGKMDIHFDRRDRLFRAPAILASTQEHALRVKQMSPLETEHVRLGHVGVTRITELAKKGLLLITYDEAKEDPFTSRDCGTCQSWKAVRMATTRRMPRAAHDLAVIHVDITGPFSPSSEGDEYMVDIVDDRSGLVVLEPIKTKGSALDVLVKTVTLWQNQLGIRARTIRSDDDVIFRSARAVEWYDRQGYFHQHHAYRPELNGKAERTIRTAKDGIRALINGSGLTHSDWHHAARYFSIILNKTTIGKDGISNFTLLTGRPSGIDSIRTFGSWGYAQIPRKKRTKESFTTTNGELCQVIGQSYARLGWLVRLASTGTEMWSRDVKPYRGRAITAEVVTQDKGESDNEYIEVSISQDDIGQIDCTDKDKLIREDTNISAGDSTANSDAGRGSVSPHEGDAAGEVVGEGPTDAVDIADGVPPQAVPQAVVPPVVQTDEERWLNRPMTLKKAKPGDVALPGTIVDSQTLTILNQKDLDKLRWRKERNLLNTNELALARRYKNYAIETAEDRQAIPPPQVEVQGRGRRTVRPSQKARENAGGSMARLAFEQALIVISNGEKDPTTYRMATTGINKKEWTEAVLSELQGHTAKGTWRLARLPQGRRMVGCRWVFVTKRDADGKPIKRKARLVAQGFSQQEGIDFDKTFSPVGRSITLRTMLAIGATDDHEIMQGDVEAAYLNGVLKEEVYMRIPEGLGTPTGSDFNCVRVVKALYGLKQSGRVWWMEMSDKVGKIGFRCLKSDWGVYVRDGPHRRVMLYVYVDDLVISGKDKTEVKRVFEELGRFWKISGIGEVSSILGLKVTRDRKARKLWLTQPGYIDKLVDRFPLPSRRRYLSPLPSDHTLTDGTAYDKSHYRELIGSLMWIAGSTRPDITFAVMYLSRAVSAPTVSHYDMAMRVVSYLENTREYGISLGGEVGVLEAWVDADFAGCTETRKSTSGFLCKLNGSPIAWSSKRQGMVAGLTAEAEYVAMSEAGKEVTWLRRLLEELGVSQGSPTVLHCDNQAAIHLTNNPITHQRTKHIDIQFHMLRDMVANNIIKLTYTRTADQLADIFTKALPRLSHEPMCLKIGISQPNETALMVQRTRGAERMEFFDTLIEELSTEAGRMRLAGGRLNGRFETPLGGVVEPVGRRLTDGEGREDHNVRRRLTDKRAGRRLAGSVHVVQGQVNTTPESGLDGIGLTEGGVADINYRLSHQSRQGLLDRRRCRDGTGDRHEDRDGATDWARWVDALNQSSKTKSLHGKLPRQTVPKHRLERRGSLPSSGDGKHEHGAQRRRDACPCTPLRAVHHRFKEPVLAPETTFLDRAGKANGYTHSVSDHPRQHHTPLPQTVLTVV